MNLFASLIVILCVESIRAQLTVTESIQLLQVQLLATNKQVDDLKKANGKLEDDVGDFKIRVVDLEIYNNRILAELETMKQERTQDRATLEKLTRENESLIRRVAKTEFDVSGLASRTTITERELIKLRSELTADISNLEKDLIQMQQQNQEIETLVKSLTETLDEINTDLFIDDAHSIQVTNLATTSDEKYLISSSADRSISLWNLADNGKKAGGLNDMAATFTLIQDGYQLITAQSFGPLVYICNSVSLEKIREIDTKAEMIFKLYSNGADRLFVGLDGQTLVVDLTTDSVLYSLSDRDSGPIKSMVLDKSKKQLFTTSQYVSDIHVWNAESGEYINTLSGHTKQIEQLIVDENTGLLISSSHDTEIKLWNTTTFELVNTLTGHTNRVLALAIRSSDGHLISGSEDKTIKEWDLKAFNEIKTVQYVGQNAYPTSLFINSKDKLITGDQLGHIKVQSLKKLLK